MTKELQKKLTTKRWLILIASCLINLCIGSLYAWSVFSTPMADHLTEVTGTAFTASTLAIVFTLANSIGPVTLISGGFVNDRLGPKWVIFVGGIFFGGGMIISGMANSLSTLLIGYGLGCGLGMGLVYGCTISNSVKFFPDKRGLIGGIATASYGISSVLIPPVANALIDKVGVQKAFTVLGIVFLVVVCGGAFLIEKCPDGFVPEGYQPAGGKAGGPAKVSNDKDWKGMLADPVFYVMIVMLTCGAVFGLMMISQVSPMAQNKIGMSVASATIAISVLALFNAAGRVIAGYVSDIIGRINTLTIMLVMAVVGLVLLYGAGEGDVAKFYIGVSVVGLCFGAFMGVFPGFTADQFGQKNNSVNYGIMFIGFALAGYVGPTIVGKVYANSGSYDPAFKIAMILAGVGILLTIIYRVMSKKKA
ncbi:MAG: OFA family MFS transporter [Blautia sp.]|nr:OFA family MFS transporter [Blautia sp.]